MSHVIENCETGIADHAYESGLAKSGQKPFSEGNTSKHKIQIESVF